MTERTGKEFRYEIFLSFFYVIWKARINAGLIDGIGNLVLRTGTILAFNMFAWSLLMLKLFFEATFRSGLINQQAVYNLRTGTVYGFASIQLVCVEYYVF